MKKHEEELSEIMLEKARSSFEHFNNPYYAWYAIDVCIKNKKALPSWLIQYLAQCSERMLSGRARQTRDLRELLPWVIGFPKKRGPGNSLDPDRALDEISFTLEFVLQIMLGNDPVTARRNACEVLEGKAANVDDKTLMRWLLKQFNLKKAPANAEQWKNVIRQRGDWYIQLNVDRALRREHFVKRDRVSRDPVVTARRVSFTADDGSKGERRCPNDSTSSMRPSRSASASPTSPDTRTSVRLPKTSA